MRASTNKNAFRFFLNAISSIRSFPIFSKIAIGKNIINNKNPYPIITLVHFFQQPKGTPGQATSYTLGQQTILELRETTKKELGNQFNIKDFHYALLSVGQAPFDYIKIHLENYVKCKTKKQKEFKYCDLVLNSNSGSRKRDYTYNDPIKIKRQHVIKSFSHLTRRKKHL